jgi:hypothetical protein
MFANATRWIRGHPLRCAVYLLLAAGVVWGALTARGILRGERNPLLTRVAQSAWLRGWVEREFHVRYSIGAVAVFPKCGLQIDVRGVNVELVGAAAGGIDRATVCASGSGQVRGIRIGPQLIGVSSVQVDWPRSIQGEGVVWRDGAGELLTARSFSASPSAFSGGLEGLRVLDIATVDSASAALGPSLTPAVLVNGAQARGIHVRVTPAAIAQAPVRFQAAANTLQGMATASLPFPAQMSAAAQRLLRLTVVVAAALLLALKLLVTRAPSAPAWRMAAVLAPFAAFPLLALTHSWLAIAIAAPLIALFLWALAYRHAGQWQQRWEPAAVDVLVMLLALPMLLLLSWPAFASPRIPAIDQVSVAQLDVSDTAVVVQQPVCGRLTSTQVSVPQISLTNLRVTLDASILKTLDVERVTAAGEVAGQSLAALRKIRYLPAQWEKTPPIAFCASVAVRNSGPGKLPEAACPSGIGNPAAIARAAVDYTGRAAQFAVTWTGAPAPLTATGWADMQGARIDDFHTTSGAPVKIAKGSARATWTRMLAASAQLQGVEASGAAIEEVAFEAHAPMLCAAGPLSLAAQIGKTSYAFGGNTIALNNAAFDFTRPDAGGFSATARIGALSLTGPVEASIPGAEVRFAGLTSREQIPERLTLEAAVSTPSLVVAAPFRLAVNLWTGDWQLVNQPVAIEQRITTRLPQSIALEVEASGRLTSLAGPLRASAGAQVHIPRLVPDIGPVNLTLNDLLASGGWDAVTGLAPVRIASGWSVLKPGEIPSGFRLNQVSTLHVSTRGDFTEAPAFGSLSVAIPSVPSEFKFRFEGTPRSISIFTDGGPPVAIDEIATRNFKASLPGLRFQSAEMETDARVKRAGAEFPVSARTRLTDLTTGTALLAPLAAEVSTTPRAVRFALSRPLDTGKLLSDVGLTLDGITPRATLSALQVDAGFVGTRLAALDVAGTVAPGPLASGRNFDVWQDAPSTFHVAGPALPNATAWFSAPSVTASLNAGRQRAWFAADASARFALTSAAPSPLAGELTEAAAGLLEHARKANLVFGGESAAAYPLHWDLEVDGGQPAVSLDLAADTAATYAKTVIHSLIAGKQSVDGWLDLSASTRLDDGHLLVDLDSSGHLGALGQRWQWNTPVRLALRSQLHPGAAGELFDAGYYDSLGGASGPGAIRVAVGYGPVLQLRTGYRGDLFYAAAGGEAQAAIRWAPDAASVDSFGAFTFKGLEAGAVALPNPYLEDRLDGAFHFATQGFRATGLTLPRLLADASSVHALDHVDIAAQVHSAADGAHLPGIAQAGTRLAWKPAGDLLRLLTGRLDLSFSPRAMQYQRMALDFQVKQGQVQSEPVLVTLSGVGVPGVNGLTVDSNVRVHWGGQGVEPAPKLRDLIYAFQRVMEP